MGDQILTENDWNRIMKRSVFMPKDEKVAPGEVVLDFSEVRPFEPLDPKVIYLNRVTNLTLGKSKEGKPKTSLELTIEAPEEVSAVDLEGNVQVNKDGSPRVTKAKGRKLFREFSLEPKALPFLYEFIKAADPEAKLDEKFRYNPKKYMGLPVATKIKNEEFDEQVRARVTRILPASAYKG